jgi:GTP-binding protein
MRASGSDEALNLIPPQTLDIEKGLEIMGHDDYLEVTPTSTRLRKQNLTKTDRTRALR